MRDDFQQRISKGAKNLLINCADCKFGQKLLILFETENDGYYDPDLTNEIVKIADELGLQTELYGVPISRDVCDPDPTLSRKLKAADRTLFLARMGDQLRFRKNDATMNQIISYALNRQMLASPFGTVDYRAFETLKRLIERTFAEAAEIHVTCPAGTDFRGRASSLFPTHTDTTRKRFPVSVFTPIPAANFSGRIAQNGFLTGTGSHYYTPWSCPISETLFINFKGSKITHFDGSKRDIEAAQKHYEFVGNKYGIDTYHVHSWHAGIHPGCKYPDLASKHFERWSGGAFGNPRILHFHTCGDYPPGEISVNVLDPTVRIDGIAIWENGKLHPERLQGGSALLEANTELRSIFQNPAMDVGQAACGKLVYA